MRKLLNNPRVVLPMAILALLWVLVSYGVITPFELDLFNSRGSSTKQFSITRKNPEVSVSDRAVESLIKEQWLPRSWQRYSVIQHEPFVADYIFEEVAELEPINVVGVEPENIPVPKTAEELATYIVENLGLDEECFFVRFGSRRIRVG